MGVTTNADEIAAGMYTESELAQEKLNKATRHHAILLEAKIKANASGRPGPNVITGNYRRSWNTRHRGATSTVGTNAPQARRLEWGFYGPDALGRVYHQPPFPHVGPAIAYIAPLYRAAIDEIPSLGG